MCNLIKKPPMGWNSWDCWGAAVTEDRVRANAEYMRQNLKEYGWEYIVVDIEWFEPMAKSHVYNDNAALVTDEYGRLMPAKNRFPSASDGKGFKSLADYVHSLGLKFGIHILRGIPKQAVRQNMPIKNSTHTAAEIADFGCVCDWNKDMVGVDMSRDGAQEYYNSLFELYASWGVDFIKVDDIARPYREAEIEAIRTAIDACGRKMVLSLSPGAAPLCKAEHLSQNANMWRITDDFWDTWEHLRAMFDYCRDWFPYVRDGHYPDCDMLPLGRIRLCKTEGGEMTNFTVEEQKTLMSLWAVFRSPLMFGGDMPYNDEFTLSLMQNREIININQYSRGGREVYRKGNEIVWAANADDGTLIAAHFNIGNALIKTRLNIDLLGLQGNPNATELWSGKQLPADTETEIPAHGVKLYKISAAR